ncbi:MAG: ABC transporter permease subunit [Eubacteriales bacterium]|nr:ABC transporter permease subunit [Eubacteriales bacterium]
MWARLNKPIRIGIVLLFWLFVWQGAASIVASPLLLPGPVDTLVTLFHLAGTAVFWKTVCMTLLRVAAGYLLGAVIGTLLGILTAASPFYRDLLSPLRTVIKATPVTSFIILVLLWLTASVTPVLIAFLMVVPMFWATTYQGIVSADVQLLEMAEVFHLGRKKTLRHIYLPSILPQYIAVSTTALGFAWKSGVAAEVIASPALSIGRSLIESKLYVETPDLFAWTLAVILLSVLLEWLVVRLLGRVKA